jgi:regulator of protease activity HflC (stomatin/prohibitin superfamily)
MSKTSQNRFWEDSGMDLTTLLVLGAFLLFTAVYVLMAPEPIPQIESSPDRELAYLLELIVQVLIYPPILFLISLVGVRRHVKSVLDQFCQQMYDLPEEETLVHRQRRLVQRRTRTSNNRSQPIIRQSFIQRVLAGLPAFPPYNPTLPVREGRVLPGGPEMMRRFGGPGFLSVGHDNAVVIAHHGILTKILGPGFHRLKPFEKVWDVVDLRPQRRGIVVKANTRDGIPVSCEADIRFHLDNGEQAARHALQFTEYSRKSVLNVTTQKVVLAPDKEQRFTDWRKRIASGVLDGQIRNWIERRRMDELLAPNLKGTPVVEQMQTEVEAAVREIGLSLGVFVEHVDIKSLDPDTDEISKQWLELWKAEWDQIQHKREAEAKAKGTEIVKLARLRAKADLVVNVLRNMERLDDKDREYLKDSRYLETLVFLRFIEAVRKMAEGDQLVRSTMFGEGRDFINLLESFKKSSLYNPSGFSEAMEQQEDSETPTDDQDTNRPKAGEVL